jgi:CheY-like chemotaxis protein
MGYHILAVEDDELVQSFLKLYLENEGYEVTCVGTGKGMIDALSIKYIDLVILDLGLPDIDGLNLTERVRERSSVPIVIATARQDQEARLTALELGADDYLTKPYDPKELLLRVRNILGRAAAEAPDSELSGNKRPSASYQRPLPAKKIVVGGIVIITAIVIGVMIDRQQMNYSGQLLQSVFGAGSVSKSEPSVSDQLSQRQNAKDVSKTRFRQKVPPQPESVAPSKADLPPKPLARIQPSDTEPDDGRKLTATEQPQKSLVGPDKPKHFSEVLGYGWILKSKCTPTPKVGWWVNKTNLAMAGYVQRKQRGIWKNYIEFWENRLANLQRIPHTGSKAILPNGTSIVGKPLEEYVQKMKKRVAVVHCLSGEAAAAK